MGEKPHDLGQDWYYNRYEDRIYDMNREEVHLVPDHVPEWVQSARREIVNRANGLFSVEG
jgi:hypothetical protein